MTDHLRKHASIAVVLIRIAIAFVFATEGILKFIDPDTLGVGRFAKIGIPAPEVMAPIVGVVEIAASAFVLVGLVTWLAALALVVDMIVAIVSTKIPIVLGHGFWGFADPTTHTGFFAMAHEARTDIAMLLGCSFLLVAGPGAWSIDAAYAARSAGR